MAGEFVSDIQAIRERARQHIAEGAITAGYTADRETVIKLLNEALATEIVCTLRYKRHYFMAEGINAPAAAAEFAQHATEEQAHADQLAARIVQLGGQPDFSPQGLATRSHAEYVEGDSLVDMIKEDLVAERIAIESYAEAVRYLADHDITSRRLLESILAVEEEHADDLVTLLKRMDSGIAWQAGQSSSHGATPAAGQSRGGGGAGKPERDPIVQGQDVTPPGATRSNPPEVDVRTGHDAPAGGYGTGTAIEGNQGRPGFPAGG